METPKRLSPDLRTLISNTYDKVVTESRFLANHWDPLTSLKILKWISDEIAQELQVNIRLVCDIHGFEHWLKKLPLAEEDLLFILEELNKERKDRDTLRNIISRDLKYQMKQLEEKFFWESWVKTYNIDSIIGKFNWIKNTTLLSSSLIRSISNRIHWCGKNEKIEWWEKDWVSFAICCLDIDYENGPFMEVAKEIAETINKRIGGESALHSIINKLSEISIKDKEIIKNKFSKVIRYGSEWIIADEIKWFVS